MSEMGAHELQCPVHCELLIYQIPACLLISECTMLRKSKTINSVYWQLILQGVVSLCNIIHA